MGGADLYRDAHVGLRARLIELETRLRERESEVTEAFWASLDPKVRAALEAKREALEVLGKEFDAGQEFEQLAQIEQQLASYLDELEAWIARLPGMEAEWRELPDEVPDPPATRDMSRGSPSVPSEEAEQELARSFAVAVRERDREAQIVADGRRSLVARFRSRNAPFSLRATAHANAKGQIADVTMWLVTSVPRAMPRLLVRHESLLMSLATALGLKHEVEVGEPSFDGLFLIQGAKEAAMRLLGPNVRTMLLALARFDVPTLEIDPPSRLASLRWRFEPSSIALDAATRVLASIRAKHAAVRFRR